MEEEDGSNDEEVVEVVTATTNTENNAVYPVPNTMIGQLQPSSW